MMRDGTAEPVSRDHILRRHGGQGNVYFPCSGAHDHDSQPYPVNPYSSIIGTQLRDPINSGLTRWRMAVS